MPKPTVTILPNSNTEVRLEIASERMSIVAHVHADIESLMADVEAKVVGDNYDKTLADAKDIYLADYKAGIHAGIDFIDDAKVLDYMFKRAGYKNKAARNAEEAQATADSAQAKKGLEA